MEITTKILDEHIEKLINIVNSIEEHKLTVIVGCNGTGKSLVRKQLNLRLMKDHDSNRSMIRHASQQLRTELRSDLGALACVGMDSPTEPTSIASYDCVKMVIDYDMSKKYFIVLDEAEIGMSKESVLGLIDYLDENMDKLLENTLGVLIITHSSIIAEYFVKKYKCSFYNLGYNSVGTDIDEWLNRDIKSTDFNWLHEWSLALFKRVNERSESAKRN